jgi:dienelactone hydrolase
MIGAQGWPSSVPAQFHYTHGDPFKLPGWAEELAQAIRTVNASVEVFEYAGGGHLFIDPSLPEEYDQDAAQLLWRRALEFGSDADRSQVR